MAKTRDIYDTSKRAVLQKSGFTLIELLVSIVIIGVLISLLIVVVGKARSRSYIAGCASNLRQIGIALLLYADDQNGNFPSTDDDLRVLYPTYINDLSVFTCPATGNKLTDPSQIVTVPPGATGIGMDYEYRGSSIPITGVIKPPSLLDAEQKPTSYLLAWDSDNKGTNRIIDSIDNHGVLGGNKLFSDGSVRWFPASEWGFGE